MEDANLQHFGRGVGAHHEDTVAGLYLTVDDPHTFTRQWTVSRPMRRVTDGINVYEYACHEGNHAMENVLRGARSRDREDGAAPR